MSDFIVIIALGAIVAWLWTLEMSVRALERAARLAPPEAPDLHDTPDPHESETRMSMSEQQLRTLGLSRVRRAVAGGNYKAADLTRWKAELGEAAVQQIVDDAKASAPAPAPREHKKATTSAKE